MLTESTDIKQKKKNERNKNEAQKGYHSTGWNKWDGHTPPYMAQKNNNKKARRQRTQNGEQKRTRR